MTPEELKAIGDGACVSVAAAHDCMWTGNRLEPHLWDALRVELQRRYRRSTGETMAVLTIENHPAPRPDVVGSGSLLALLMQALRKIAALRDSEADEPFDEALDIADAAVAANAANFSAAVEAALAAAETASTDPDQVSRKWLPADEAPRGTRALIRHRSGLIDVVYKTNNGEPFLETWRYAGTARGGEQAPWPDSYMPINELYQFSTTEGSTDE